MKKVLFSALMAFGMFSIANAQAPCTPDTQALNGSNGIVPDTTTNFAPACLNQPYSQVISVRVPTDTTAAQLGGQTVSINYIQVAAVNGLPPGLDYECMTPDCKFPGGTDGCAVVKGTPTQLGTFPLVVKLKANVQVPIIGAMDNDMDDVTGWKIIVDDCGTTPPDTTGTNPGTSTLDLNKVSFKLYPNPASEKVMIANLAGNGVAVIEVMNTAGQLVGRIETTNDMVIFGTSNLNQGVYFVQVTQNNHKEITKLVIE